MDILWFILATAGGWYFAYWSNSKELIIYPAELLFGIFLLLISSCFLMKWIWQLIEHIFISQFIPLKTEYYDENDLIFIVCIIGLAWLVAPFILTDKMHKQIDDNLPEPSGLKGK